MKFFDAHLHIIDPRFPLIENQGYLPGPFTCGDYHERLQGHQVVGGAVVSGSFQAFDQGYLLSAMQQLGSGFVGVTQLPEDVSDEAVLRLSQAGVRAIRFNVKRGGSADLKNLDRLARRVHEIAGWHAELYIDGRELAPLLPVITRLPGVSIDHLGLSREGLPNLYRAVEQGVRVKVTGFGRINFPPEAVLQQLFSINPAAPMFGTDLPCTRAPRPFAESDIDRIIGALDTQQQARVFYDNALAFYHLDTQAN